MRKTALCSLALVGCWIWTSCSSTAPSPRSHPGNQVTDVPGLQHDGAVRLPNQWFLKPVGKQILVGDFPANMAVHPSGKFAAVLHCGYGPHEVIVIDLKEGELVSRVGINQSFYGIHFSQAGDRVFCS